MTNAPTEQQVTETLEESLRILDKRGWCRGYWKAPDGRVCLEGAVMAAVMGEENLVDESPRDELWDWEKDESRLVLTAEQLDLYDAAAERIAKQIKKLDPDYTDLDELSGFNDELDDGSSCTVDSRGKLVVTVDEEAHQQAVDTIKHILKEAIIDEDA